MPLLSNKTLPKNAIGTLDELMSSMIIQQKVHYISPQIFYYHGYVKGLSSDILGATTIQLDRAGITGTEIAISHTCLDHRTCLGTFFWTEEDAENYFHEFKERRRNNAAYQDR
jgi:hypothetical protein